MPMSVILVTKNLTKRYGDKVVLDRVNLDVQEGDILGLVGKNGAGKTTLIRVLTDVARPSDGSYSIFGVEDQRQLIPLRRNIAAMVESPAYYDSLTAEMNIINRCIIMEQKGDYVKIAEDMLHFVGLSEVIGTGKKAKDFSLGMRQRLGIALALVGNPKLLILDEPTNGLDPEGIVQFRELLLKLNREKGITMIVSSHILSELSKLANRYVFLDEGKVVRELSSKELESESSHRLELTCPKPEEAMRFLEGHGFQCEERDGAVLVYGYNESIEPLSALIRADIEITRFKEVVSDLEAFFVSLLEEGGEA